MAHASTPLWMCTADTLMEYLTQHYPSAFDSERIGYRWPNDLPRYILSICEDMVAGAEEGCKTVDSAAADLYAYIQETHPKHNEAYSSVTGLPRERITDWPGRPFNAAGDWDYKTNPEYRGRPLTPDDWRQAARLLQGHDPTEVAA